MSGACRSVTGHFAAAAVRSRAGPGALGPALPARPPSGESGSLVRGQAAARGHVRAGPPLREARLARAAAAPSPGRPRCAAGMAARAGSRLWSWLQVLSACTCWGFLSSPARQHRRYQVNGMLGGTAWLVLNMPPGKMVDKSHLDFQPHSGERGELAVLKGGHWERSKAPDRFGQRLEIVNKTVVRITPLEKGDGGLFEASVRLPSAEVQHHLFNLTVYAPVSEPQILLRNISKTPGMCNVTLWCWVPGDGEHNVSWAIGAVGRPRRVLGGSSDWHQLSDHGSRLQLLWRANLSDSSINCLVRNPVDQKNTSFDLLKICPNEALQIKSSLGGRDTQPRGVWITLTIWAIVACIVYAVSLQRICSEMRRDKRKNKGHPGPRSTPASELPLEEEQLLLLLGERNLSSAKAVGPFFTPLGRCSLVFSSSSSSFFPPGTASFPVQNPLRVSGVRGGSALLPVAVAPPQPVSEIEWKFQGKAGLALLVAKVEGGRLERPNPRDRFRQRLEMASETALRIRALEMEDSGAFHARVRLATGALQEHVFHLAVYGKALL
ncbi:hypothetical protein lerEdw1_011545 [Lerista edwardsae]|nr:hypothetical protein lerEdw1_011545 [Lerista edwardsae]